METPTPAITTAGVDILFQLHGFNKGSRQSRANGTTRDETIERIPQQLPAAMVAVLPQGTELSSFGSLDVDGIVKDALGSISAAWGAVPVRRVALGGHSGGGGAVAGLLATKPGKGEKPGADPAARRAQRRLPTGLSEVMLFDGINGGGQEESSDGCWTASRRTGLPWPAGRHPRPGDVPRYQHEVPGDLLAREFVLCPDPQETQGRHRQGLPGQESAAIGSAGALGSVEVELPGHPADSGVGHDDQVAGKHG